MTKNTQLLPPEIREVVALFVAAGYEVTIALTDNGHRILGDTTPLTAEEKRAQYMRGLSSEMHEVDVSDIVTVRFRVPRTFETATLEYRGRDLPAIGAAASDMVTAELPGHMPATSRRLAESLLASGFSPRGHLIFAKGDNGIPFGGLRVTLSWC